MRWIGFVSADPLVRRLATDLIPRREVRQRPLAPQPVGDERDPLIHGTGVLPGHPWLKSSRAPSHLLPMQSVYFVTFLSGSDHPFSLVPFPFSLGRRGLHRLLSLRLRHDPDVGPRRLPALGIFHPGLVV